MTYTRADFVNDTEVRWCPGCGDYAVLAALQRVLPELGLPPEKHVFISGIGCAGRLPYYMNTYGFHTIHGRALPVATGLKALHDDLCVWVITGDGDALSIGGNHLIHCLRRNVNINILLLNNQVYGLTKGQFSPTSQKGQITKTSPEGVMHAPIDPLKIALSSGASFVARAVDKDPTHLASILKEAYYHEGCAFIEIYQDCHVFNTGAFDDFSTKTNRASRTVCLTPSQPLVFGADRALDFKEDKWVTTSKDSPELLHHDPSNWLAAMRLTTIPRSNDYPVALGVYYQTKRALFALPFQQTKTAADVANLFTSS